MLQNSFVCNQALSQSICKGKWFRPAQCSELVLRVTKTNENILFLISFPYKAPFSLYCTNKMDLPSWRTNKTLWFYWFLKLKPAFLLYCTKKTNHFKQKCRTVPKKQKKHMFLDHWPRTSLAQTSFPEPKIKKPMLFWYSTALLVKKIVFFVQYSKNEGLSFKNK